MRRNELLVSCRQKKEFGNSHFFISQCNPTHCSLHTCHIRNSSHNCPILFLIPQSFLSLISMLVRTGKKIVCGMKENGVTIISVMKSSQSKNNFLSLTAVFNGGNI
jgi:hypothetical protein